MNKIKYFFFLIISCILTSVNLNAQITVTIGTGTSSNSGTTYPAPYGNWYWGARHQFLIKASELTAAGAYAGNIENLAFRVATANGAGLQNFAIQLKNTSVNSLSNLQTGTTTVWSSNSYTETSGWNTHTFSSPFYWDGTSNLIVETCFNNSSYTNNASTYYTSTSFNSCVYYYQDAANVCSTSGSVNTGTFRPNIKLGFAANNQPPSPNFIANTTNTCSGVVSFSDLSAPTPTAWKWYFGDGDSSSIQNPTHTYLTDGTYSVTLIASNQYGDSTKTISNYISVNVSGGVPKTSACLPLTQNGTLGFGITNFTFNTINNNSANASEGYKDFTCTQTQVYAGATYNISAITNVPTAHNVRVWIDYNNDSILNNSTELVYFADSVLTTSGTVKIPDDAVLNAPLRLRVSADYVLSSIPTPCSNPQYGQAEDYTVKILPNPYAPETNFEANKTTTCDGLVSFTDLSANTPTQWLWYFGDDSTSVQKNPTHTYIQSGTYTVTLIASNANGIDTIVFTDYITVNLNNNISSAGCTPQTLNYCCGYGIFNVSFNGINNSTGNASEGYKDFSCENVSTVIEGNNYTLSVRTGAANNQDTKVWIDYNDDGTFDNTELVFEKLDFINPTATLSIPTGKTINKTLRMRISSDYSGSNPDACSNLLYGQTEDYGILIQATNTSPVAGFTADKQLSCNGQIQFTDTSSNTPTTWTWTFGDGQTSNLQHPLHTYTQSGIYNVKLKVTNAFGADSILKSNYINVDMNLICDTVYMPLNSNTITATTCRGMLMDNGGASDYYSGSNSTVTIAPAGASSISLSFQEFYLEDQFDFLYIFDGPNISSPQIGVYTNYDLWGNTINSSGGALTLYFSTDNFNNYPGFIAEWSCASSINENKETAEKISLFPNPAKTQINIDFGNIDIDLTQMSIINVVGQVIFTEKINKPVTNTRKQIDISNIPEGIYLLVLKGKEGNITKRIIKE